MKLGEALRLKIDLRNNLSTLIKKIEKISERREDRDLEFDDEVKKLMFKYQAVSKELLELETNISLINSTYKLKYPSYYDNVQKAHLVGELFSDELPAKLVCADKYIINALLERERLKDDISNMKSVYQSCDTYCYSDDKKYISTLDRKKLSKKIDSMSKFLRILDNKVQENNWLVDFEKPVESSQPTKLDI